MNRIGSVVVLVFAMCVAGPVRADDVMVGDLKLTAAWARATPKGATVGGGYFTVTNTGNAADRLVGGTSNVSNRFEIHQMSMDKGVMKMREVTSGIEIKPGQTNSIRTLRISRYVCRAETAAQTRRSRQGDTAIRKSRQCIS